MLSDGGVTFLFFEDRISQMYPESTVMSFLGVNEYVFRAKRYKLILLLARGRI